jgi:hypothetical protein
MIHHQACALHIESTATTVCRSTAYNTSYSRKARLRYYVSHRRLCQEYRETPPGESIIQPVPMDK